MTRVLVLILTYNGERYVDDCLSSLRPALCHKDAVEVLLVDNASTDNSVELARGRFPEVRVVENSANLGFAGGNNVGLRWALERDFDYIYLLNQDTEVHPRFLDEALRVAESDATIAAVQSKILLHHDKATINTIGNEIHFLGFGFAGACGLPDETPGPGQLQREEREITYASGAAVLLRASALYETGVFNEELFVYHEDLDLGWRLRLLGYRIVLAPKSIVYHKYEFSRGKGKFYYMERNRYLVMLQNCRVRTLLLLALPASLLQIGMLLYALANGYLREEMRILAYFCRTGTWPRILDTRRCVQRARRVGDRVVFDRFLGTIESEYLKTPIIRYIANPFFTAYWRLAKPLIHW
jgi:GT2 family glycosyltransferase